MVKKEISAADMKAMLIAEFERLRPKGCKTCSFPAQHWGPAPGPGPGYWYMDKPVDCPHGCRQVIAELWAKATTDYNIAPPPRARIA